MDYTRRAFLDSIATVMEGVAAGAMLSTYLMDDAEAEDDGFAAQAKRHGFRVAEQLSRSGNKKVMLIGDDHSLAGQKKAAAMIDYLLAVGYGSIGMESIYGPPAADLEDQADRAVEEAFEGRQVIRSAGKTVPLVARGSLDPLGVYVREQKVPVFGLEDKELYLESLALTAIPRAAHYAAQFQENREVMQGTQEFITFVSRKYPQIPLPGRSMAKLTEGWKGVEAAIKNKTPLPQEWKRFLSYADRVRTGKRTQAFARNGMKYMGDTAILSVGYNHLRRQVPGQDWPVQDHLPYAATVLDPID